MTDFHTVETDVEPVAPKKPAGMLFWVSVGFLAALVLAAIFAKFIGLQDPLNQDYNFVQSGPSAAHWFGTDDLGRDIFSRVIYGSRISLVVSTLSMAIGFGLGTPLAMMAAYRRGRFDTILTAFMYSILAFPAIIANIAILSFWTPRSLTKVIIVVGLASTPLIYRVVRTATLAVGTKEYVMAAKVQGASDSRIMFRELLPNVFPIVLSFLIIGIASVVVLEGSLAFLGLSVMPPTPSWGNMINEGRNSLQQSPWLVLFPSLVMCLFLLSINFVGERLRSRLDVSEVKL